MVNIDMPFDIWDVLVNEVIGNIWLFVFLGIGIVMFIAMRNQMPFQVSTVLAVIFILIIVAAVQSDLLFVLIILAIGSFLYFQFKSIL